MRTKVSIANLLASGIAITALVACSAPPPHVPPIVNTAPTATPMPPVMKAACTDHSNIKGMPSGTTFLWRFHLNFYQGGNQILGCLSLREPNTRAESWRTTVPCELRAQTNATPAPLKYYTATVLFELPEAPLAGAVVTDATRTLTYTVLAPGNYIACDLNLNQNLVAAQAASPNLGIYSINSVYTYTYFSMSALMYLTDSQGYAGTVIGLEPQCPVEMNNAACEPSVWNAQSGQANSIVFMTEFGTNPIQGRGGPFTYAPARPQAWWVGIRDQFDTMVNTYTVKLEHIHDQVFTETVSLEALPKGEYTHRTQSHGRKYAMTNPSPLVEFYGDQTTIYIGGGPGRDTFTFNGGLFQIMVDPVGGGAPNGGG